LHVIDVDFATKTLRESTVAIREVVIPLIEHSSTQRRLSMRTLGKPVHLWLSPAQPSRTRHHRFREQHIVKPKKRERLTTPCFAGSSSRVSAAARPAKPTRRLGTVATSVAARNAWVPRCGRSVADSASTAISAGLRCPLTHRG
jgi:hypothetical protein